MKHLSHPPDIRDFVLMQAYLESYYEWRKSQDRTFSYTRWAKDLGLQSRVFLKLMVAGQRSITERSMPLFIRGLGLDESQAAYFTALARFQRATTSAERELHLSELCRHRKPRARPQPVLDHYRFLSSPLGARVQALLTYEREVAWSASELATLLGARPSDVQEVLRTLSTLGLAREEGGGWCASQPTFEVKDDFGSLALRTLHRKNLEDAIKALDSDPAERRYLSLSVFLTPAELLEFHQSLQEFATDRLAQFSSRKPAGARLYQAHFSLIPVSGPILQPEKSSAAPVEPQLPTPQDAASAPDSLPCEEASS
jgi:uncharacterized protein (TIGR02147 family)